MTKVDDAFTSCRSVGHNREVFYPKLDPPAYGWRLSLRCPRCGWERHDVIAPSGMLLSRDYNYPEGYLLTSDDEKWSRDEWRQELFRKIRQSLDRANAVSGQVQKVTPIKQAKKAS